MDYDLGDDAGELRNHLRELIANNIPAGFLGACTDDPRDLATTDTFCKLLASEGLLALAWPKEHGGGGGSVWQQTVLREEMWAMHEPRGPQYMGINWVGPALMRYGTDEQKAKHLAAIASGDVIWCQGFSEPEAGTDLVSLRTRAVPDGDVYRLTGTKRFITNADKASLFTVMARTGGEGAHGVSAFLVPADLSADALVRTMKGADKALVTDVRVFDRYEGDAGLSLALEATIQPTDKTLTEAEIVELSKKLVAAAEKLGATLRG